MKITTLVPAHNESSSIGATIEAMLAQTLVPHIVVIPNGCTDDTAEIARRYPVTVMELPKLAHRKSEALNLAWSEYAKNSDMVICLDADTILPDHAVADWAAEIASTPKLAGSSSKFTMQAPDFLSRLQKAEFATWTDTALRRKETSVLAGTGAAISGAALRELVEMTARPGPWSYDSQVEDFELTYQLRKLGYFCQVSPTVRAYTDSMKTVRALWGQRMKWQVGTVEDLLTFGLNRYTLLDWSQQAMGILSAALKVLWVVVMVGYGVTGLFSVVWVWALLPVLFISLDVKRALRIPHKDWKDIAIACSFFPYEAFNWIRSAWFIASWVAVLKSKITGQHVDRWNAQYVAEGK